MEQKQTLRLLLPWGLAFRRCPSCSSRRTQRAVGRGKASGRQGGGATLQGAARCPPFPPLRVRSASFTESDRGAGAGAVRHCNRSWRKQQPRPIVSWKNGMTRKMRPTLSILPFRPQPMLHRRAMRRFSVLPNLQVPPTSAAAGAVRRQRRAGPARMPDSELSLAPHRAPCQMVSRSRVSEPNRNHHGGIAHTWAAFDRHAGADVWIDGSALQGGWDLVVANCECFFFAVG
ncbi:hypothetical protein B0T16DRAFT_173358 [Cercophora newfieldiana]|uniref:Uncharacterized protein n=1 Tax=Cercophora newfieldiana TaxID=92897 RepID=A0AA40CQQ1_9PEZI|nr:hypothetical protein B0T16DRAFT_173358 [Cercophora newfieldiana]